jgi:hypothetical protein
MVKTPLNNFSQIAVEAEKIEGAVLALTFAKKECEIRAQRRKLFLAQLGLIFSSKF